MNQIDKETFFLWLDHEHSPALNMAFDEELLSESAKLNSCFLRFYNWDRNAMSIGYIQSFSETFKDGYELVRRPTGGGVVFHDIDLTYTVVIPSGHIIEKLPREESYFVIHKIIMKALASIGISSEIVTDNSIKKERMKMQCFTSPAKFDISSRQGSSNSKVAGAAQRRTKLGILHQGSIVFDKIKDKKTLLIKNIIEAFESELNTRFDEFTPNRNFFIRAEKLADEKYSRDSWNKMR